MTVLVRQAPLAPLASYSAPHSVSWSLSCICLCLVSGPGWRSKKSPFTMWVTSGASPSFPTVCWSLRYPCIRGKASQRKKIASVTLLKAEA